MKKNDSQVSNSPFNPNYMPQIDPDTFDSIAEGIIRQAKEIRDEKHDLYFSHIDVVRSFTKCAQIRNKALPTMIADLMVKHFQSISDMVNSEYGFEETIPVDHPIDLELWDEKIVDLINYTLKLYAAIRVIRAS